MVGKFVYHVYTLQDITEISSMGVLHQPQYARPTLTIHGIHQVCGKMVDMEWYEVDWFVMTPLC